MRIGAGVGLLASVAATVMIAAIQSLVPASQREFWLIAFYVACAAIIACIVWVLVENFPMGKRRGGYWQQKNARRSFNPLPSHDLEPKAPPSGNGATLRGGPFTIINCSATGNAGDGFHIEADGVHIENTKAEVNGGHGIFLSGANRPERSLASPKTEPPYVPSRGIVTAGKDARFGKVLIEGYDIGIDDTGENTSFGETQINKTVKPKGP